jgi:hypothetical protein
MANTITPELMIDLARRTELWFSAFPVSDDILATNKLKQSVVFPTYPWPKSETERQRHYALAPDVGLF